MGSYFFQSSIVLCLFDAHFVPKIRNQWFYENLHRPILKGQMVISLKCMKDNYLRRDGHRHPASGGFSLPE